MLYVHVTWKLRSPCSAHVAPQHVLKLLPHFISMFRVSHCTYLHILAIKMNTGSLNLKSYLEKLGHSDSLTGCFFFFIKKNVKLAHLLDSCTCSFLWWRPIKQPLPLVVNPKLLRRRSQALYSCELILQCPAEESHEDNWLSMMLNNLSCINQSNC